MDIITPIMKKFWKQVETADNKRIAKQTPTSGIEQIVDIPYIDDGEKGHLLDIYYPEGTANKLPVIIDVHGGGWMYGYKDLNKHYNLKLASMGFLVASISYRLVDDVRLYEQIRDIFTAYKWLGDNLKNYPADTNNIFLTGDSAGGHFACVSAAINISENLRADFDIEPTGLNFKAVGAVSPAVKLANCKNFLSAMTPLLLGKVPKNSKYNKYLDFSQLASKNLPPFYIVTSSGDFIRSQAYLLKDILAQNEVEYEFSDFTGKDENGKKLPHVFPVGFPDSPAGEDSIRQMTDFFKSYMD